MILFLLCYKGNLKNIYLMMKRYYNKMLYLNFILFLIVIGKILFEMLFYMY